MSGLSLVFPFATPSQNELKHWHWGKYHAVLNQYRWVIRQQLLLAAASDGLSLLFWPAVVAELPKLPTCTAPGCKQPTIGRDARSQHWCMLHDAQKLPPAKRHVRIVRHSHGELDRGNFIGGCKPLLDALCREGVLYDDRQQWLEDEYEQRRGARGEGRTEVTVSTA